MVLDSVETSNKRQNINWKPFLRQFAICTGPWTLYFMQGLAMGFPTVLVPQLRQANHTISMEKASWLPTTLSYSGIPWILVLVKLTLSLGRKKAYMIISSTSIIGFSIYVSASDFSHFLICQFCLGAITSSYLTTSILILVELTSSKYRGIFLTIKSATFFWGVLVANTMGTFFHWRYIGVLGIISSIYCLVSALFWPESPLWLASRGRFEECAAAHRWLKGEDEDSEKELNMLIKSFESRKIVKKAWTLRGITKTICRKQFLKPIILSYLLVCQYCFSGKLICTVFALEILKKITRDESGAYSGMLIIDCVTLFSMYLGCILSRVVKRRMMLLGFTFVGIVFLVLISLYLYLVKLSILHENKYVALVLLTGYSVAISCGPMILGTSIIGELLPMKSRMTSMCVLAFTFKLTYGTFMKISPFLFKTLEMHGTFTLYAIVSTVLLVFIYIYLPETKDKTIQEIDDSVQGRDKLNAEEVSQLMSIRQRNLDQSR